MPRTGATAPISYTRAREVYRARVLSKTRKRPAGVGSDRFYWRVERPVRRVLGWLTRDQAQDLLIDLARAGELDPTAPPAPDDGTVLATVGEVLQAWLDQIQRPDWRSRATKRPLAPNTLARYRAAVNHIGAVTETPIADWHQQAADRWILEQLAGATSRAHLELQLVVLGQALRWAHAEEYVLAPGPTLELPGEWDTAPRLIQRRPEPEEVLQVIAALRPVHARATLSLRLLYATGARRSEVCALQAGDVEYSAEAGAVLAHLGRHVGARKTGERSLPLPERLGADVLAAAAGRRPGARLALSTTRIKTWLDRGCELAEVERFSAKGLRYLKCKTLMDAGVDPARYEAWMGHSYAVGKEWYRQIRPGELVGLAALGREPEGRVYDFKRADHTTG